MFPAAPPPAAGSLRGAVTYTRVRPSRLVAGINIVLLAGSLVIVYVMARGAIWSPY